jgi:hypothetical protein
MHAFEQPLRGDIGGQGSDLETLCKYTYDRCHGVVHVITNERFGAKLQASRLHCCTVCMSNLPLASRELPVEAVKEKYPLTNESLIVRRDLDVVMSVRSLPPGTRPIWLLLSASLDSTHVQSGATHHAAEKNGSVIACALVTYAI